MFLQCANPFETTKKPTDHQLHTWQSIEVQNVRKKTSRYGHTTTIVGDNMIVIGGVSERFAKEELACMNIDLKTMVCEKIQVTGRDSGFLKGHSTCYWKDNKFIIFGGCEKEEAASSQVSFSIQPQKQKALSHEVGILTISEKQGEKKQTAHWELAKSHCYPAPIPHITSQPKKYQMFSTGEHHPITRYHHTAHIYQDKMFVIGGLDKDKSLIKHLLYLDLNTWMWHKPSELGNVPKDGLPYHSSFLFENKIYVFASTVKNFAWDIFKVLDLDTLTWEDLDHEGFPPMIRNMKCAQPVNGHVYILGVDGSASPSVQLWSYDIRRNTWHEVKQQGKILPIKKGFSFTQCKDQLYTFGGSNASSRAKQKKGVISTSGSYGLWAFSLGEGGLVESSQKHKEIEIDPQGPLNMSQIMKKLLKEAPYSDIIFEVESKEIPAHKWFLIKNSKYFANMFSSGMIESKTSRIPIPDMKAKTFESFLEFLYTNDVKLDKEITLELLEVADKYSVPDLKVKCEEFLVKNLDVNNYVRVATMADLLDSVTLRKAAIEYMAKNIKQLKSQPDFEEVSDDYLREIIIKLTVR